MSASFTTSTDGYRIAYDVIGSGAPLILLHGGGRDRKDWHTAGYVDRLKHDFQVIAIDIRGNGESGRPIDPASYTTDSHCQAIFWPWLMQWVSKGLHSGVSRMVRTLGAIWLPNPLAL